MRQRYLDKFLVFLMLMLIVFAVFLQITTVQSTQNLKNAEIEHSKLYASKMVTLIRLATDENIEKSLNENVSLRAGLNKMLYAFLTEQYKYIFLLHRDNKNKYHFLADASKENPVRYKEYFFPHSKLFDKVYNTGKMELITQNDENDENDELWVSLVYPILNDKGVESLLVLDLSKEYANYLQTFNASLFKVVSFVQWFLFLSLLLLLFLGYRYYKIRQSLIKDSLTSLHTRYYLNEFFYTNKVDGYDFVLMDIDGFKAINQKYGRSVGDEILTSFSERLNNYLPKNSKIIRLGGSEFFAIIPKKELKNMPIFVQELYNFLQKMLYLVKDQEISLSISMTAIDTPENVKKIENILRLLDEKLLKIKKTGKNRLEVLDNISISDVRYTSMNYIREALEKERFTCLYQPICTTLNKEVVKYEVLVRMCDREDETKLVPPKYFLNTIRGTSQYIKLSKFVLAEVFETLRKYPVIELSMNLDLDDLDNVDMMQLINDYLVKNKSDASRLTFEIVEENEIYDYEKVNTVFSQLRKYGSKIAIDDFGSGYANYTYLTRLDIDIIKLDANFVHDLEDRFKEAKIVISSIKTLAHHLECQVIAEFVHNESVYLMLKEIGVEFVQGYYLGKPKMIKDYLEDE